MTLHLLCPTLSNPNRVRDQIQSFRKHSSSHTILWYCVQDPETQAIMKELNHENYIKSERLPTAVLWQMMSDHVGSGNHMLLGDDVLFFEKGWDTELSQEHSQPLLLNCDNLKPTLELEISRKKLPAPHYCVNEAWRRVLGWFVPPLFSHYCVDSWCSRIAIVTGTYKHCRTSRIIHDRKSSNPGSIGQDQNIMNMSLPQFGAHCEQIARATNTLERTLRRLAVLETQGTQWHHYKNFQEFVELAKC